MENASVREMEFDILSVEPTNVAFIHRLWQLAPGDQEAGKSNKTGEFPLTGCKVLLGLENVPRREPQLRLPTGRSQQGEEVEVHLANSEEMEHSHGFRNLIAIAGMNGEGDFDPNAPLY